MTVSVAYYVMTDPSLHSSDTSPHLEKETIDHTGTEFPCKVLLFNDNIHTFDEVIAQLIKATGCSFARAESIAWEVHNKGKAVCYIGNLSGCLQVVTILEEIALHTQIEP
jgi:ATP-dependent Clp protease adaptor protein ClpS